MFCDVIIYLFFTLSMAKVMIYIKQNKEIITFLAKNLSIYHFSTLIACKTWSAMALIPLIEG